jgi:hypothetical protein
MAKQLGFCWSVFGVAGSMPNTASRASILASLQLPEGFDRRHQLGIGDPPRPRCRARPGRQSRSPHTIDVPALGLHLVKLLRVGHPLTPSLY